MTIENSRSSVALDNVSRTLVFVDTILDNFELSFSSDFNSWSYPEGLYPNGYAVFREDRTGYLKNLYFLLTLTKPLEHAIDHRYVETKVGELLSESSYDIARRAGFMGSVEDWYDSLVRDQEDKTEIKAGVAFHTLRTTHIWWQDVMGHEKGHGHALAPGVYLRPWDEKYPSEPSSPLTAIVGDFELRTVGEHPQVVGKYELEYLPVHSTRKEHGPVPAPESWFKGYMLQGPLNDLEYFKHLVKQGMVPKGSRFLGERLALFQVDDTSVPLVTVDYN